MTRSLSKVPTHASFFDLDKTLLKGNSSSLFFRYLIKRKILPRRAFIYFPFYAIKFHFFNMSLHELHEKVFNRLLRGRSFDEIRQILCEFILHKLPEFWNDKVVDLLKRAQELGHYTVILSNAPSFLVEPIARLLKVDDFRATEYEVDEKGFFKRIRSILDGHQKAHFVKKLARKYKIAKSKLTAYSDSILDLPMLIEVDHPIVVNPDAKLEALSQENKWEII